MRPGHSAPHHTTPWLMRYLRQRSGEKAGWGSEDRGVPGSGSNSGRGAREGIQVGGEGLPGGEDSKQGVSERRPVLDREEPQALPVGVEGDDAAADRTRLLGQLGGVVGGLPAPVHVAAQRVEAREEGPPAERDGGGLGACMRRGGRS